MAARVWTAGVEARARATKVISHGAGLRRQKQPSLRELARSLVHERQASVTRAGRLDKEILFVDVSGYHFFLILHQLFTNYTHSFEDDPIYLVPIHDC